MTTRCSQDYFTEEGLVIEKHGDSDEYIQYTRCHGVGNTNMKL